jgi:hypothetical protein
MEKEQPELVLQGDRRRLNRWRVPGVTPKQLVERIEEEARAFLEENGRLTMAELKRLRMFSLQNAISRYYPGGQSALRRNLGLTPNRKPPGYWQRPEAFAVIRNQAAEFYDTEGYLTQSLLNQRGRGDLSNAISRYPGGMRQLKEDLGLKIAKKANGYWTPDRIQDQVIAFVQSNGRLAPNTLSEYGRDDLRYGVTKHYPGGWRQLRVDLGLQPLRVPNGSWTPEKIREEAQAFYQEHGHVSRMILEQNGRSGLIGAAKKYYPGGWSQLRLDLGLKALKEPWTPDQIKREAKEFYQAEGKLTQRWLEGKGHSGLSRAIKAKYPGGWIQLRIDLGLEASKKPKGYWTQEMIEKEGLIFFEEYGSISHTLMQSVGNNSLSTNISTKYPGGIKVLKEKLGITNPGAEVRVEDANQDLDKLLEEQND